jgi:hypothetical protein
VVCISGNLDLERGGVVDLIIFMGQSNMAGRGDASKAPTVPDGWGYEFRAISAPDRLYPMAEPFGAEENIITGINEPGMKTGSMVSAFTVEYYKGVKVPVVGISASKGASSIDEWQPGGSYLDDSIKRFKSAEGFLMRSGIEIRNRFMVWCQGERDGGKGMPGSEYKEKFNSMLEEMQRAGIERCFLVQIGFNSDFHDLYVEIMNAQIEICDEDSRVVLVSAKFKEMLALGLMKDEFHYFQEGYNIVGAQAGQNAALFVLGEAIPGE